MMKEYPCTLASVPIDYRKLGNGMIFQKNWPYASVAKKEKKHIPVYSPHAPTLSSFKGW